MIIDGYKLGYDDVSIVPSMASPVSSRGEVEEVNRYLWVSPMDTVINNENIHLFTSRGLNVPMVRGQWKTYKFNPDNTNAPYITLTLNEVHDVIKTSDNSLMDFIHNYIIHYGELKVLIDVANGHMESLMKACHNLMVKYDGAIKIVTGNIAYPLTYSLYSAIHGLRLGIGSGSRCLTSSKTGVHYPMISLINETYQQKCIDNTSTLIIADGGIKNSSDMCKAFAAGADGVMMGSLFNRVLESAGKKYAHNIEVTNENLLKKAYDNGNLEVMYRGMSTIDVQMKENGFSKEYEEGFSKRNIVDHTLDSLLFELNYVFKSMLSYSSSITLDELHKNSMLVRLTPNINHNNL